MESPQPRSVSSPRPTAEPIEVHLILNHRKLTVKCEPGTSYDQLTTLLLRRVNRYFAESRLEHSNSQVIGFTHRPTQLVADYLFSIKKGTLNKSLTLAPFFKKQEQGVLNYQVYKCLAVGGFSKVYLVRSHADGNFYVMKVISKIQKQNQEPDLSVIENQKQINSQMGNHPFIVNFIESFETENFAFFILEYCPGGELFYNLKRIKRMNEDEARFYFIEILFAFEHLHSKGILYRDLKPENIFIAVDGHVKLGDFGLSRLGMDSETLTYSYCGSAEYMAPEMIMRTGHSFQFDFYTLGAMLYELVVGIPPFYSHDQEENRYSILNQQLQFPDDISLSEDLKNFLTGLLNKNPKLRLGCLKGTKQIKFHPWVGMVNSKRVLEKSLVPPFLPTLDSLNFDENQIGNDEQEFTSLLKKQIKGLKGVRSDISSNKSASKLLRNYSTFQDKLQILTHHHSSSHKAISPYLSKMSLFKCSKLNLNPLLSKHRNPTSEDSKLPQIKQNKENRESRESRENKTLDINNLTREYILNLKKKRDMGLFLNQSKQPSAIKHRGLNKNTNQNIWKNRLIRLEPEQSGKTSSVWQ